MATVESAHLIRYVHFIRKWKRGKVKRKKKKEKRKKKKRNAWMELEVGIT